MWVYDEAQRKWFWTGAGTPTSPAPAVPDRSWDDMEQERREKAAAAAARQREQLIIAAVVVGAYFVLFRR